MHIVPLQKYQPDRLVFRVGKGAAIVLRTIPQVPLFLDGVDGSRFNAALTSMESNYHTFFRCDERLLLGPVMAQQGEYFFECQILDGEVVLARFLESLSSSEKEQLQAVGLDLVNVVPEVPFANPIAAFRIQGLSDSFAIIDQEQIEALKLHRRKGWCGQIVSASGCRHLSLHHKDKPGVEWRSSLAQAGEGGHWSRHTIDKLKLHPDQRYTSVSRTDSLTGKQYVVCIRDKQLQTLAADEGLGEALNAALSAQDGNVWRFFPMCNSSHYMLAIVEPFNLVLEMAPMADEYRVVRAERFSTPLGSDLVQLDIFLRQQGLIHEGMSIMPTREAHVKLANAKPLLKKSEYAAVRQAKPDSPESGSGIQTIQVRRKKQEAMEKHVKMAKAAARPKQMVDKPSHEMLFIHSFSKIIGIECFVEIKWAYGEEGGALLYSFEHSEVRDYQINCELLALRDVLVNKTQSSVDSSVGAQEIELIVSKGAIKRMLRIDSTKIKDNFESARYLMARCCGSRVDVKKVSPFNERDQPERVHAGMAIDSDAEKIDTAIGPVRLTYHAVKRVMERAGSDCENAWSCAVRELRDACHSGNSNGFAKMKHVSEAVYLHTHQWRFVVGKDKNSDDIVVYTAYPNRRSNSVSLPGKKFLAI